MKLLLLIHRLPFPADRGSKIRAAAELRHLAARHDVWCAGFIDGHGPESIDTLQEARALCREVFAVPLRPWLSSMKALCSLGCGLTATEGYFQSAGLTRQVLQWSKTVAFDAVIAHSSCMAPLALQVPARRRLLDLVDLDSRKWKESAALSRRPMSLVYQTEAQRLEQRELDWIRAFEISTVCAERERQLLAQPALREKVHVIKTCVDPDAERLLAAELPPMLPQRRIVGFIGAMDYPPNIEAVCWFAEHIWPSIRSACPDACFWIAGRSPSARVQALHNGDDVRVTGAVPSLVPYLKDMYLSVAPLRLARGLQTKVLTAMAAGRPCVVTSCVAEGIGARDGCEVSVADGAEGFADRVIDLLKHRNRAEALGRAGFSFVADRYRVSDEMERLERLIAGEPNVRQERVAAVFPAAAAGREPAELLVGGVA